MARKKTTKKDEGIPSILTFILLYIPLYYIYLLSSLPILCNINHSHFIKCFDLFRRGQFGGMYEKSFGTGILLNLLGFFVVVPLVDLILTYTLANYVSVKVVKRIILLALLSYLLIILIHLEMFDFLCQLPFIAWLEKYYPALACR